MDLQIQGKKAILFFHVRLVPYRTMLRRVAWIRSMKYLRRLFGGDLFYGQVLLILPMRLICQGCPYLSQGQRVATF